LSGERFCERRSRSAARGGVDRPVEKCGAQLSGGVGQENRGGSTVVKDAVQKWKATTKEVFIPLSHPPGEPRSGYRRRQGVWRHQSRPDTRGGIPQQVRSVDPLLEHLAKK